MRTCSGQAAGLEAEVVADVRDSNVASLDEHFSERVRSLASLVAHVQLDIEHRRRLSVALLDELLREYLHARGDLLTLGQLTPYLVDFPLLQRRDQLEHRIADLLREQRAERVACFRDIATLHRELRQWRKEYEDASRRLRLLTGQ